MKTLILGADGQLGLTFQALVKKEKQDPRFLFWRRSDGDFNQPDFFQNIRKTGVRLVINCAAYTAVDQAEMERTLAKQVNATAVGKLGKHLAEEDIPVIHFSSDYVYHNRLRRPLREDDPCRPKGYYARTKLMGENELLANHPYPLIIRVSWLYSNFRHNFPKTMLRLGSTRDEIRVVNDQWGAPTYAHDLAKAILTISDRAKSDDHYFAQKTGIYNYSNEGKTTWFNIADRVIQKAGLRCQVIPIPSKDYPTPAPRPRYSVLDLAKFKRKFEIPTLTWEERMDECIRHLINETNL